jgi:phage baseplate assembly protein W
MAAIDFKSVGEKTQTIISSSVEVQPTPIGIKTPLRFGNLNGGIFGMYTELRSTINDNLKNLLLTNHGERLVFQDFGANLAPLTLDSSEFDKDGFDAEAAMRIKAAVSKYMPFIALETFESRVDHHDNKAGSKIKLRINYAIPRLNVTDQAQEVTLFLGG